MKHAIAALLFLLELLIREVFRRCASGGILSTSTSVSVSFGAGAHAIPFLGGERCRPPRA